MCYVFNFTLNSYFLIHENTDMDDVHDSGILYNFI